MTNAEARFNNSLRPRKPEGSLGRTAQDVHLDSHTAPELCRPENSSLSRFMRPLFRVKLCTHYTRARLPLSANTRRHASVLDWHTHRRGACRLNTQAPFSLLSKGKQLYSSTTVVSPAACDLAHSHTHTHSCHSLTHTHTHTRCIESAGFEYDRPSNPSKCRSHYTAWLPVAVRNQ